MQKWSSKILLHYKTDQLEAWGLMFKEIFQISRIPQRNLFTYLYYLVYKTVHVLFQMILNFCYVRLAELLSSAWFYWLFSLLPPHSFW